SVRSPEVDRWFGPRVNRVVVGFTCGELTVAAWAAGREHQGLLVLDWGCVERQSAPEAAQRSARRVSALRSPRAGSRRLGRYRRVSAENADLRLQFLVFAAGEGEIPLHRVGIVGSQRSRSPLGPPCQLRSHAGVRIEYTSLREHAIARPRWAHP